MELSLFDECRKKRLSITYALIIFATALFYAAVCTPIHIWAYSNILVSETAFLIIWDGVVTTVGYCFYWFSFSFVLYFISRFAVKNSKSVLGIYLGASAFLYTANLLSSCIVNGFSDFVINDLLDILMYVAFDVLQMAIVVLLAWRFMKLSQDHAKQIYLLERSKDPNAELKMPKLLPFVSVFDFKNPLLRSVYYASAVSAGLHILSRVRYDLFVGMPADTVDLIWMIFAYVSELLAFLIGVFVIILILNQLYLKEEQRKFAYEK